MGLKTWITGMFLSATLSGQAQEAQPEATQQKQDTTEVNAPAASITDVAQHMQKVRKSLTDKAHLNFNQQLNNEFGPNGSRISSSATIRQAAQQDVSLVMPEMQAKLFNQDMQKILQEEFQTTMSDFQKRVEKRTTELHTKYGDFIANGAHDNQDDIKGGTFAFDVRFRYDDKTKQVVFDWKPSPKRLTPLGKKLQSKQSRKETLSKY